LLESRGYNVSYDEIRELAEIPGPRTFMGDDGEPDIDWGRPSIEDELPVVEDELPIVEEVPEELIDAHVVEEAVETISTTQMMEFGAGMFGLAFAIVTVIWSQNALSNDRNEVFKKLDDLNLRFKNELTIRQEQLHVTIFLPQLAVRIGDTWRKTQYAYSTRDTYGPFVLSYLKWRYDNPQIRGADIGNTCLQIAALYRRLLLPGPCTPQDTQMQAWSEEQYKLASEMGIAQKLINNDIHTYLKLYSDMQSYLIKKNLAEFNTEIRKLAMVHTTKTIEIKTAEFEREKRDIPWSDAVGFYMAAKNLTSSSMFEFVQHESDAIDLISSPTVDKYMIVEHMRSLRGFIEDVLPLYMPDATKTMFTIAPPIVHRTQ
jgi:hypothetical protein